MLKSNKKQENLIGYVCKGRYQIIKKLKSGGFGSVYLARDLQNKNKFYAIKIIDPTLKFYAQIQCKMYSKIKQNEYTYGFLKYFDHGIQNNKYFIILELLDKDLDELIIKMKKKVFSLKTVLMIGLQVIDRLQAFHKIGYLHRDVKPDNLVVGFQQKNKVIYLIDFGLAKRINQKRPEQEGKLLGSLGYMSCRAHEGKATGPSDDIESLIYTMLFLLNGQLPWTKLNIKTIAQTHKILIMKKKLSKTDFKHSNPPNELFGILAKVRQSSINQKVDYLKIKYQFLDILKSIKAENDFHFDWQDLKSLSPQKTKGTKISPQKLQKQKQKYQNQKLIQKQIYEVYAFFDKPQNREEKLVNIKNQKGKIITSQQKIKSYQINNKRQQIKKNPQKIIAQKKARPFSAVNRQMPKKQIKEDPKKAIQFFASMRYSPPKIVINRTVAHKF